LKWKRRRRIVMEKREELQLLRGKGLHPGRWVDGKGGGREGGKEGGRKGEEEGRQGEVGGREVGREREW